MKRKLSIAKIVGVILAVVQLVLSGLLSMQIFGMGFLPTKYWAVITAVLALLFLITFATQFFNKAHWIGKIIAVLIIAVLAFCIHYVGQVGDTLEDISDAVSIEKNQVIVVVKKDSPAQTLNDLKAGSWGIQYADDVELMGKAADKLKEMLDTDLNLAAYDDYEALYPALISGEVDAMVLNSSYLDMIDELTTEEEEYRFSDEIRVIETLEFEAEAEKPLEANVTEDFDITKDPFIAYVSGIDTYGDITTRSRSDVNILLIANPETRQILMVTTPRDGYVIIPGISGSQKDKLTHAGIYGINKSIDTINSIYDIDINYYARVNFNSVINIVDALGGVDVYSRYDFTAGGNHFTEGYNHLDGKQALAFSRERYAFAEGDNQRGKDQMEVIKGIIRKCTTPAILTGFSSIMNEISDQVQTNLPTDSIYALVKMQLEDSREWEMYSYAITATGSREYCYSYTGKSLYVANLSDSSIAHAKSLMEAVMNGEKLTEADVVQ
ncbi:MAG: LCP family protein [Lachnospiraceae bacterium]